MRTQKDGLIVRLLLFIYILSFCSTPAAAEIFESDTTQFSIATIDSRPLYLDRLVYAAFSDLNLLAEHTAAESLSNGYDLADSGVLDGVISLSTGITDSYPNLRLVPVSLEQSEAVVFARSGSGFSISDYSELVGLRVGILADSALSSDNFADCYALITVENERQLYSGLIKNEYDVGVLLIRDHEVSICPGGIERVGQLETFDEYLYLHKNHVKIVPQITKALYDMSTDGRAEKIRNNQPVEQLGSTSTLLHIMSSSTDISRQKQFSEELTAAFVDEEPVEWYTLPLNSKRYSLDPNRTMYYSNLLRRDCVSRNIEAIIISGEEALDFVIEHYYRFFYNVSVLVYGVGEQSLSKLKEYEQYFTGIIGYPPAYETVITALKLFPERTRVYVLNDYTSEGKLYRSIIETDLAPLSGLLNIQYNADVEFNEIIHQINTLPENSTVLVGSYYSDSLGQYFSNTELQKIMERECGVPVFTVYSTDLPYNAIGGRCLDYTKSAQVIINQLKLLREGESISEMPYVIDPSGLSTWAFNKQLLDQYGVSEKQLPSGSVIYGKPSPIWETNPLFVLNVLILLTISISITVLILIFRRRDNILKKELHKALVAAEDASHAKTTFLANMSHELRTPINSIIGFSELALDTAVIPETRSYLFNIKNSSEVLKKLIDDILDISKIEAGKLLLEHIPFNLHDLIADCQMIISPRAAEKGISLYCYAVPSVEKQLVGDPTRLRQILLNLLSNAVKFTDTGTVSLLSEIVSNTNDSVSIRFEVADSGIGMTLEQLKKISEPFMQADSSTTRRYGGTGLGIPISTSLIEQMGGELTVESTPSVGSKFSFTLSFDMAELSYVSNELKSEVKKPIFNGEVLVCEDNRMNQEVIAEHLERVGLKTVIASNGREGVDLVTARKKSGKRPFDLIFMDIHMPVMDGIEAAKHLSELGSNTPIIALTANIMDSDKALYAANGMPYYLAKPFKRHDLWRCLQRHLTPAGYENPYDEYHDAVYLKQRQRQITNFIEDYSDAYKSISTALEYGDMDKAYLQLHSLKSVAALIGMTGLSEIAGYLEQRLSKGDAISAATLETLKIELQTALSELTPHYEQGFSQTALPVKLDLAASLDLLNRTQRLLRMSNSDCLDLIGELRHLPGSELLITQIESYDFEPALITLKGLIQLYTQQ